MALEREVFADATWAHNKGMKLSKPGDLGGSWPLRSGIIESGFAAYAQCWATSTERTDVLRIERRPANGQRTTAHPSRRPRRHSQRRRRQAYDGRRTRLLRAPRVTPDQTMIADDSLPDYGIHSIAIPYNAPPTPSGCHRAAE